MSLFAGIMAGSCQIVVSGAETIDEFGQPIPGSPIISGPHPCYFFQPKGTVIDLQSGTHEKKALRVMLPAFISVKVGDVIRGMCAGYTDDYAVISVEPAYTFDILDHWECDLEIIR